MGELGSGTVQAPGPKVSVIVPVGGADPRLRMCLTALEAQTYPQDLYEVIVVENGSESSLATVVAAFSQARWIHEPRRGSYTARNAGLDRATGTVIAFTDADCIPCANWLEAGVNHLTARPDCGLAGGRIQVFPQDAQAPTACEFYEMVFAFPQQHFIEHGHFAVTANAFTFRCVFEELGGFCDDFKSGGDAEWGQRVFGAGYQVCYAGNACVRHPARRTWRALRKKSRRIVKGTVDCCTVAESEVRALWRHLRYRLPPPLFKSLRLLKHPAPAGLGARLQAIFVLCFLRYYEAALLTGVIIRRYFKRW
ncbi:MAG: glycosyltransferase [Anaerolineae bacterium]|nr:glycosyltransferase [Anaerolineae bacterium]